MASYTTNLNLKKPAGSENVAIGDINNNMDAIDQAYGTMDSKIASMVKSYKITRDTSGTSHSITVPSSSWHLITIATNGTAAFWMGYVFCNGSGGLSTLEIKKGSDITVSTSTNQLSWSTSASRTYNVVDQLIVGTSCS
jgi:hypothetical protein